MHSLIQLTDDCLRHGSLDAFSAFKYENNIQFIKSCLRSSYKPLEQCVDIMEELESLATTPKRQLITAKKSCRRAMIALGLRMGILLKC